MPESIFTKIIHGEIPCHKIYEDEHTFAFMDLYPVQEGMIVIASKQQIPNFEDLPPEIASAMMLTAQKMMKALRKTYPEKKKIGAQIAGINTPDHAHVTIFPINSGDEFLAHSPTDPESDSKLAEVAERIRANL